MDDYVTIFHESYSTALLVDAAYRAGAPLGVPPSGLVPLDRGDRLAGPVVTLQANNDLVSILATLHRAQPDEVIVITNRTFEVALLGDLIATEAHRKGLTGFVVDGLVRDSATLREIGLPVFCRGTLPLGPLKLPATLKGIGQSNVVVTLGGARVSPGDWVFGDADGVIFLAPAYLSVVFEWAERSSQREEALAAEIRAGAALGDLLGVEAFLEKRAHDPVADFNAHLADLGRAI